MRGRERERQDKQRGPHTRGTEIEWVGKYRREREKRNRKGGRDRTRERPKW
jgi:hypothetical protein